MKLADGLILLLWERAYGHRPVDVTGVMNLMSGISLSVAGEFMKRVSVLVRQGYISQAEGDIFTLKWGKPE